MDKKELRKHWIAALRSGNYNQVTGRLKTPDGYCCLGVACEVYEKHVEPLKKELLSKGTARGEAYAYEDLDVGPNYRGCIVLPNKVAKAYGLKTFDGDFSYPQGHKSCLTDLNDNDKKSFSEIADVIESEPKGLFDD